MTLDERLVERVDRAARRLGKTRSAFTRDALRDALSRLATQQKERQHRRGYEARPVQPGEFDELVGGAGVARLRRGEVRWYAFARPDKKRPVVILTRDSVLEYLGEATIAPDHEDGARHPVRGPARPGRRDAGAVCRQPRSRPDGGPRAPRRARDDALHAAHGRDPEALLFALDFSATPELADRRDVTHGVPWAHQKALLHPSLAAYVRGGWLFRLKRSPPLPEGRRRAPLAAISPNATTATRFRTTFHRFSTAPWDDGRMHAFLAADAGADRVPLPPQGPEAQSPDWRAR